jgi:hypothetical protein
MALVYYKSKFLYIILDNLPYYEIEKLLKFLQISHGNHKNLGTENVNLNSSKSVTSGLNTVKDDILIFYRPW